MKISDLSNYWKRLIKTEKGLWMHPDDQEFLSTHQHSFNLDFPPPAFVGNIEKARIIILTANGGYDPLITPQEFQGDDAEAKYLQRLSSPSSVDWSEVAPYYSNVNYAELISTGKAATVNACAYRSNKISAEPENKKVIKSLPSVAFARFWLLECVLPLAKTSEIVIVAKRYGLWALPKEIVNGGVVVVDPAPVSPHLSMVVWEAIEEHVS